MNQLSRRTAWTSSVLYAGLGQFYLDKPVRGWFYVAAESAGLLTALAAELQRSDYSDDYLVLHGRLRFDHQRRRRPPLQGAGRPGLRQHGGRRDSCATPGLLVALGAVTVSVLDALITFPGVDAGPGPVPPVTGFAPGLPVPQGNPLTSVHAAVKLTF